MRFKIVSTGWNCAQFIERTLRSVESQSVDNWDIWIIYDPSDDDGADVIRRWCDGRRHSFEDSRWNYTINNVRQFAVRNQYEAVQNLQPEDDDVVVWLDLDGDQLAHEDVLKRLGEYYAEPDGPLVTYGSYRAVPDNGTSPPAVPFPHNVVQNNAYRDQMRLGTCCFNHLRTMKGRVVNAIPRDQFFFSGGPNAGEWYTTAGDYIFMACALELAGGRYKMIPDVLLLYNHANPYADYLMNSVASFATTNDFLNRPPLTPLPEPFGEVQAVAPGTAMSNVGVVTVGDTRFASLEPEDRRELLREYGRTCGRRIFIETGTNQGLTPLALVSSFDQLFTIELDDALFSRARDMFAGYPNVHCLHGDSTYMLPEVLARIEEPALVWLDGHYSGPGTAHGEQSSPIREELRILFEDKRPHVILVDDARIFGGGPEHTLYPHYEPYPELGWVQSFAQEHDYTYYLDRDIMRLLPS